MVKSKNETKKKTNSLRKGETKKRQFKNKSIQKFLKGGASVFEGEAEIVNKFILKFGENNYVYKIFGPTDQSTPKNGKYTLKKKDAKEDIADSLYNLRELVRTSSGISGEQYNNLQRYQIKLYKNHLVKVMTRLRIWSVYN